MGDAIDFILELTFEQLPEPIVDAAIRALTDTLGVAIAGSTTRLSSIIHDHAAEHFAAGSNLPASLWCDGRKISPAGAALANGMTIDSIDAHDGHKLTKGHVGCGVIPALLAFAEATGRLDGQDLLASVVVGYEIGTRAGISLHSTVQDYHTSGAWVALATAALGARYLGLNREHARHAIGIAEYHGPRSQMMRTIDHPSMVKDGSGWGAMAGVSAAYLARDGFTGAPAISVEGSEVKSIWGDLGSQWYVTDQYIKLYPVCRWAQPPVEAVLDLQRRHEFGAAEVVAIQIDTFHEAKRLCTRHPKSTEEAQYSLPFSVASALVHGTIGAQHIDGNALTNSETGRLQDLIEINETNFFNAAFPQKRIARATVHLSDGRVLESPPTEAIGDPENPVSARAIDGKFQSFAIPVMGEASTRKLLATIKALKNPSNIKSLLDALSSHHKL